MKRGVTAEGIAFLQDPVLNEIFFCVFIVCVSFPLCDCGLLVCTPAYVCVFVCVAEPCSLSPGKNQRFLSLRGAVKKNAAFLRKACASVCMVEH